MRKIDWFLALAVVVLLGLTMGSGCTLREPGSTVGVIDLGKVVAKSPLAQRYEQQLAEKYSELRKRLEEEATKLDEEARKAREKELMGEYLELKQELEGRLEKQIDEALGKITQDKDLAVILYKESVRFGGIDVTEDVIKALPDNKDKEAQD